MGDVSHPVPQPKGNVLLQATTTFVVHIGGERRVITQGEILNPKNKRDKAAIDHAPTLFREPGEAAPDTPIEAATANPGEKRSVKKQGASV